MKFIESVAELEALYPRMPAAVANDKVAVRLTPCYRKWIAASRFCILSTVGPEGTDGSPRGDDGPVALELDPGTLAIPDWRGNNRLDTLRNIVRDPRISSLFMVPGCENVVRVNGTARLSADAELTARFERQSMQPTTVIVIAIHELYFQCAKAIMRSNLWSGEDESARVPSAGDLIKEFKQDHDAAAYDAGYSEYAKSLLW